MHKPVKRYLLEFALIFFSIIAAFYFEDYREDRREKKQYKELLIDFRADLLKNIRDIYYETDSLRIEKARFNFRGFSYVNTKHSRIVLELLLSNKASMRDIKNYYRGFPEGSFGRMADWIKESSISEELTNKYSEHIPSSLKNLLVRYRWVMSSISEMTELCNKSYEDLNGIFVLTDPFLNYDRQDSLLFYSNEFRNKYKGYAIQLDNRLESMTYYVSDSGWLKLLLKSVDEELNKFGVNTIALEDQVNDTILERLESDLGRPIDSKSDSILNLDDLIYHRMSFKD